MNLIRQYEFHLISLNDLIDSLWDFGPNAVNEVGEDCFQFYIDLAIGHQEKKYYIEPQKKNRLV